MFVGTITPLKYRTFTRISGATLQSTLFSTIREKFVSNVTIKSTTKIRIISQTSFNTTNHITEFKLLIFSGLPFSIFRFSFSS